MSNIHSCPAILALSDGTIFRGKGIGIKGEVVGEVVFNTAMTGYQEILTDPSYTRQIVIFTSPHIGNTGINAEDLESESICTAGLIIRNLPLVSSNWRQRISLQTYLVSEQRVGISEIDTRKLTKILRDKGSQAGCIIAGDVNEEIALQKAREFPGLLGMDLAKAVSCKNPYIANEEAWLKAIDGGNIEGKNTLYRVIAYDYGIKRNILRLLVASGCHVTVVPADTPAQEVLAMKPQGIFLSNGPGDPSACEYAIQAIRIFLEKKIPIFGICLGHQLLALASNAKTVKMKFGHHGANHPVQDIQTGRVFITSQNHGFTVDPQTLPTNLSVTHISLFDQSLQGIARADTPAFGFQGHPEASPGPQEMSYLFEKFVELIRTSL